MGASPGSITYCLYRRVGIVLQRKKQLQIFLSQNKFNEAWQRQTPPIFNWFTDSFQVKNA